MRFVCLDFETNGFFDPAVFVLPWTSYPIQVSLTAVENGVVTHLYDSLIKGAEALATWVCENVPIEMHDLQNAPPRKTCKNTQSGRRQACDIDYHDHFHIMFFESPKIPQ